MSRRYILAATILPPTVKVAGYRLLPFCLRHRVGLSAIGSPVLSTDKEITPNDFLMALRVLSTYDLKDLRRNWTLREQFLLGYYNFNKLAFIKEVAKLVTYFSAQSLWPKFWKQEKKSKESGIPWELTIISGLLRSGLTLQEAWQMPEAEAVWLFFAQMKAEGAEVNIMTEAEEQAMKDYEDYLKSVNQFDSTKPQEGNG